MLSSNEEHLKKTRVGVPYLWGLSNKRGMSSKRGLSSNRGLCTKRGLSTNSLSSNEEH